MEKIIVSQTQSLYIIFLQLQAKKAVQGWKNPNEKSDENPWRPVAERWDFSLLSFSLTQSSFIKKHKKNLNGRFKKKSLFSTGIKQPEESRK